MELNDHPPPGRFGCQRPYHRHDDSPVVWQGFHVGQARGDVEAEGSVEAVIAEGVGEPEQAAGSGPEGAPVDAPVDVPVDVPARVFGAELAGEAGEYVVVDCCHLVEPAAAAAVVVVAVAEPAARAVVE